jgi:hypothetical protein
LGELLDCFDVGFGEDNDERLILEERSKGGVELDLFFDGVPTLFGGVNQIEHAALEVR